MTTNEPTIYTCDRCGVPVHYHARELCPTCSNLYIDLTHRQFKERSIFWGTDDNQ